MSVIPLLFVLLSLKGEPYIPQRKKKNKLIICNSDIFHWAGKE